MAEYSLQSKYGRLVEKGVKPLGTRMLDDGESPVHCKHKIACFKRDHCIKSRGTNRSFA
jgi:hypothetical protein